MSAVAIVRAILVAHAPLLAAVPSARVIAGQVQQGTTLPAIGISEISGYVAGTTVSRRRQTEAMRCRVQVTVLTNNDYPALKRILLLAKRAAAGTHTAVMQGYQVNSVLPDNIGPEIPPGDDKIMEQSRDFIVTFAESI